MPESRKLVRKLRWLSQGSPHPSLVDSQNSHSTLSTGRGPGGGGCVEAGVKEWVSGGGGLTGVAVSWGKSGLGWQGGKVWLL